MEKSRENIFKLYVRLDLFDNICVFCFFSVVSFVVY